MIYSFSSNFDPLTEVFAVILAFCEPSNPLRIWNEAKENCLTDYRRRNVNAFLETEALKDDLFAENCVLNGIHDSLSEIKSNLGLEKVGLPKISIDISTIDFNEPMDTAKNTQYEDLNSITETFYKGQSYVVNCIMSKVLPGVTVDNPYAQAIRPFRHKCDRSRSFFLDAPVGTG